MIYVFLNRQRGRRGSGTSDVAMSHPDRGKTSPLGDRHVTSHPGTRSSRSTTPSKPYREEMWKARSEWAIHRKSNGASIVKCLNSLVSIQTTDSTFIITSQNKVLISDRAMMLFASSKHVKYRDAINEGIWYIHLSLPPLLLVQ